MEYPNHLSETDRYWFNLIQTCRNSGKSDAQWRQDNNIKSPTFYYHVKRLRQKACEIPSNIKTSSPVQQEVVPVIFEEPDVVSNTNASGLNDTKQVALRLQVHGIQIEIFNQASQHTIQHTLSALQNLC